MDYGLFLPIANDGWITSATSPKYRPTFDLNKQIVQQAEDHGFVLTFDFLDGVEVFGSEVMPLLEK